MRTGMHGGCTLKGCRCGDAWWHTVGGNTAGVKHMDVLQARATAPQSTTKHHRRASNPATVKPKQKQPAGARTVLVGTRILLSQVPQTELCCEPTTPPVMHQQNLGNSPIPGDTCLEHTLLVVWQNLVHASATASCLLMSHSDHCTKPTAGSVSH